MTDIAASPPANPREYALHGPQVEPTSSFWIDMPAIAVPLLKDVEKHANGKDPRLMLTADLFPSDADLGAEFGFLKVLEKNRANEPYPQVGYPSMPRGDFAGITALSRFLQLRDPPFGTIFDTREAAQYKIRNVNKQHERLSTDPLLLSEGQELARIFEEETPGLYHRHALLDSLSAK